MKRGAESVTLNRHEKHQESKKRSSGETKGSGLFLDDRGIDNHQGHSNPMAVRSR